MPSTMPGSSRSASARLVSGPIIRMSTFSPSAAASRKVAAGRRPHRCRPARRAGRARRAAEAVFAVHMLGIDDRLGQRPVGALVHRDVDARDGAASPACSRRLVAPDIAEHGGDMSGARPLATSMISAWASSTPPSLSRMTCWTPSCDARLWLGLGDAVPELGIGRRVVAADVGKVGAASAAVADQLLAGDPDMRTSRPLPE